MRTMSLRTGVTFFGVLALAAFGALGTSAVAQQASQTAQPQKPEGVAAELGRTNLDRVGASPEEIKAVLAQDPGLMVELKRWVAQDATSHGQIIGDEDLSDAAIDSRLDTDTAFRSVATRLLQRYGYLVPKVNPDSEAGKEQNLLIQERVKWITQAEEQARAEAQQREHESFVKTMPCSAQYQQNCAAQPGGQMISQPGSLGQPAIQQIPNLPLQMNPPTNNFQNLQMPGGALERAQLLQGGAGYGYSEMPFSGSYDESDTLDGFGAALSPALLRQAMAGAGGGELGGFGGGSLGGGDDTGAESMPGQLGMSGALGAAADGAANGQSGGGLSGLGLLGGGNSATGIGGLSGNGGISSLGALGGLGAGLGASGLGSSGLAEMMGSPATSPQMQGFSSLAPTSSLTGMRAPSAMLQPTLLRQPDPYQGIPSLYDMYLQAIPRPASPQRFGEAVFENGTRDVQMLPMDLPVGPDYVVGPGDSLSIDLYGGVSKRLFRPVDRQGQVTLPEVGPVLVSGKSLSDVQQNMQQLLRTQFKGVSVSVSLARLRTIRVYEVGDVENPGAYDISSLSTPLNALFAAGGPTQRGSLRIVNHYRGGQLVQTVDLYDLLLHGVKTDIVRLENGDTVQVPPAGPEVTVEGMVRRPAIYELKDEKNLADVIQLAGGLLPAASLGHIEVQRLMAHQERTMLSLNIAPNNDASATEKELASFTVQDGDRIRIFPIAPYSQNAVYLEGHVIRPGRYSYHDGMRVTDLISSYKDLLPEPAGHYAEIIRLNAPDFRPSVESFDLSQAMADPSKAPVLHSLDTVRVFSRFAFQDPPSVSVLGDVRRPGTYRTPGEIRLADAVQLAGGLAPDAKRQNAQVFRYLPDDQVKIFSVDLAGALDGDPAANIELSPRDRILIHRNPNTIDPASVYIQGDVGRPGRYPLAANMTVADLIRVGGGLALSADTQTGDLTRYQWTSGAKLESEHEPVSISAALGGDSNANMPLHNGDVLTIRELAGWNDLGASITLRGEVKHPGTYGIRPGERLSSVIERAGGIQPDGYAYGAILQRREVRDIETKERDQLIVRVKAEQGQLTPLPENTPQQRAAKEASMQEWQTTLQRLSATPPIGRVNIRMSNDLRRWKGSSSDITVFAGDTLTIPKRPSFVMVSGQVFNATAVSYRPGKSAKWYLQQAGGPTDLANKKAIFVVRADGSVLGGQKSLWRGSSLGEALQPGDTVVVPEKAATGTPFAWQNLFTTAQIASSLATTVLFALHY